MLFIQAPSCIPSSQRRLPPRCSPSTPSMIRAAPSTAVPAVVPARHPSPPLPTTSKPTKSNSPASSKPLTAPTSAPQVAAAAAAVRAAAASVANPAEGRPKGSPTKKKAKNYRYSRKNFEYDQAYSRANGRPLKYVRDNIENNRPNATLMAEMVAPDMVEPYRREHYFLEENDYSATFSGPNTIASASTSASSTLADAPTHTPESHTKSGSSLDTQLDTTPSLAQPSSTAKTTSTRTRAKSRASTRSSSSRLRSTKSRRVPLSADSDTSESDDATADDDTADKEDPSESEVEIEPDTGSELDTELDNATFKMPRPTDDSVRSYLSEIGEVQLLDQDSEVKLATNIANLLKLERLSAKLKRQKGSDPSIEEWAEAADMGLDEFRYTLRVGLRSKEHMVAANLRLVVSIAKKYNNRGLTFQDLIQEGSIGLIRGAEKFDAKKGFKFSTYATWWIRQAITRAIADHSRPIRLPVHVNDTISAISKATKHLQNDLGRPPTEAELAANMNLPVDKLQFVLRSSRSTISLETPMSKDGVKDGANLGSFIVWGGDSPVQTAEKTLLREDLENLLNTLTPREREVVRMRYGFDDGRSKTLEEIGTAFAVTRERIRQIESKALRKLRHPNRNAGLREYIYDDL